MSLNTTACRCSIGDCDCNVSKAYDFTLPTHLTLPRKRVKDAVIPLSVNWFRNANYHTINEVKKTIQWQLHPEIERQIPVKLEPPISITYTIYPARRIDIDNWCAIASKFFQDALVCYGKLPDDDYRYIETVVFQMGNIEKENPHIAVRVREI